MFTYVPGLRRRVAAASIAALAVALVVPLVQTTRAHADTAPVAPVTVPTVSADALPTVQIDGVVWSQVVVGNRVYATGKFAQARPAGAAAGTSQTARSNILAYDLTTGALITSWAPSLNAQGLGITASADGKRIYVVGDFTSVSGVARNRIVALDATTGAVISPFSASLGSGARGVAVMGNTVYVGGGFTTASGQARSRLAAFDATTGALLSWAPTVDQEIFAVTAVAGLNEVVVGGRFTLLNGVSTLGMAAVDGTTGTARPWAVNQIVQNYGADAAIYSLTNDGTKVYATGYGYLVHNDPTTNANLENVVAANADGGALVWVSGCRGDTYSAASLAGVLYSVGHAHDCSYIGGHPQTNPWTYQRAMAYNAAPAADGRVNMGGAFNGRPAPELLHWYPTLALGNVTGQYQGAWNVTGTSNYVVLGGEFPSVNGVAQQGLVRFAVKTVAPNKEGPQDYASLKPSVTAIAPGTVRVSWPASYDRDNRQLTYEVLRGATTSTAAVLTTRTQDSAWFNRPPMAYTDRGATPGSSQTYRIRVKDAFGNTLVSAGTAVTVPAGTAAASPYADAVTADSPTDYWRLGEASGATAFDWASGNDATLASDTQRGTAGALVGDPDTASTFSGSATVPGSSTTAVNGPQSFSVEAWFRTTSTSGGKIVGFGNSSTADSGNYDRHVYLTNSGKVVFGVYNNTTSTLTSAASYNNGTWHQVVGTLGGGTMTLYVDGAKIGSRADVPFAQSYSGYWRIGGDNLNGWPNQPSSSKLAGAIDEVAVYPTVLAADRVATHWGVGTSTNTPPTASFTSTPTNLQVAFDASASSDSDGTVASYAWTFGDGSTGTGKTVTHTYASASTYQVKLTVTDDKGATGTVTKPVTVTAANQPPAASFTSSTSGLQVSVDGSASSDSDGTVASYAWDFGDGSSGTGATTTHTYASGNTYVVKLTVTDDKGATNSVTKSVTVTAPAVNQPPTASFTSSTSGLQVSVDGSGSSDSDGTVASYAWDFGDGSSGTGATATHTYASGNTYAVKLTVTDDKGATNSVTKSVTVTAPAPNVLASDTFTRTVGNGWGTADTGGSWTTSGTSSSFAVSGGVGTMLLGTPGVGPSTALGTVSSSATDLGVTVTTDKAGSGNGIYLTAVGRHTAGGDYRGRLRLLPNGTVGVVLSKYVGTTETFFGSEVFPSGLTYTPGTKLRMRLQVEGTGTTTLRLKVWPVGTTEPAAWQLTKTDTTAAMQVAGSIGLIAYVSSSATNTPVVASFDDLVATAL